jgi:hypothetical protein
LQIKLFVFENIIGRITIRNRGVAEALPRRFKMVTLRKARTPLNSNTTKTQERDGSPERFCPGLLVTRGEMGQTSPIEGLQKRPNTTKSTLSVFSKIFADGKVIKGFLAVISVTLSGLSRLVCQKI